MKSNEIKKVKEVLSLMNSMILSGEQHSKASKAIFDEAMRIINEEQEDEERKYEYYVQKHDVSPKLFVKGSAYDEDDSVMVDQLNSMGALGWKMCGVIHHRDSLHHAKFVFGRKLPVE